MAKNAKCPLIATCTRYYQELVQLDRKIQSTFDALDLREYHVLLECVGYLEQIPITDKFIRILAKALDRDVRRSLHHVQAYMPVLWNHFCKKGDTPYANVFEMSGLIVYQTICFEKRRELNVLYPSKHRDFDWFPSSFLRVSVESTRLKKRTYANSKEWTDSLPQKSQMQILEALSEFTDKMSLVRSFHAKTEVMQEVRKTSHVL